MCQRHCSKIGFTLSKHFMKSYIYQVCLKSVTTVPFIWLSYLTFKCRGTRRVLNISSLSLSVMVNGFWCPTIRGRPSRRVLSAGLSRAFVWPEVLSHRRGTTSCRGLVLRARECYHQPKLYQITAF